MALTFLLAKGINVGASLVENDKEMLNLARDIMSQCAEASITFLLPVDFVLRDESGAEEIPSTTRPRERPQAVTTIPEPDGVAMDIGPQSVRAMVDALQACKPISSNGPLGNIEDARNASGTNALVDWMSAWALLSPQ